MATLFFFGPYIEDTLGPGRFLAVYLGSELAANALTYLKHRDNPAYSAVGASGAISGVLFSFCLFQPFAMLGVMFVIPMPAIPVRRPLHRALGLRVQARGRARGHTRRTWAGRWAGWRSRCSCTRRRSASSCAKLGIG